MNLQLFGGRGGSSGMGGAGNTGSANWAFAGARSVSNVSYNEAVSMYNAPVGTTIRMNDHQSGDYVGDYTRTARGWEGSQSYRSSYVKPPNVSSESGFASRVVGKDIKFIRNP